MTNLDINTLTEYTITHEYNSSFSHGYGHKFLYRKDSIYFISFFNYCPRIYQVNNDFSGIVEKFRVYGSELFLDAVLFPSLHEPFGIVGLEIMASKVPMITTLVGGIRSYASEDVCIKCEPTVESLEEAVHKLLSMSEDEKKQMVERAYERVRQFDWGNIAKEYTNFLQSIRNNKVNN